jgi:hypothetical protein
MNKEEKTKRVVELGNLINATIAKAIKLTPEQEQELNRYFVEMEKLKFELTTENGAK